MIKKLSRRILAVFLTVCTLIPAFALSVPIVSATEVKSSSSVSYISQLKVATDDYERLLKDGFMSIDTNINYKGYVYLKYKITDNPEEAITGIVFSHQKSDTITYRGRTYELLSDVNFSVSNFSSNCMYLYFTHESDPYGTTEFLTSLDVIQTDSSFSLKGKNYKPVLCDSTNMPADIDGSDIESYPFISSKRTYLVYESQPDPDAVYQKSGNDELRQTVKSVNGTNYYNFDADISKSDFLERAMTMQHDGKSAIESWSQVFYAMLKAHDNPSGYYVYNKDKAYSFDDLFGDGLYFDLVAALTNGTGVSNSFAPSSSSSPTLIRSSGVKTAKDMSSVYTDVCNLHFYEGNPQNNNIDLDFLKNEKSHSDIVYSLCSISRGAPDDRSSFSDTVGVVFYNFELIPIIENGDEEGTDLLNYADSYTTKNKNESSVKIDKNDSSTSVSSSKSFSSSVSSSTTNAHATTNGNSYTVTKGVSFGASSNFGNKIPLTVNGSVNLSMAEAFNFSESDTVTESITKTITNNDSLTFSIPAYSIAALNCVSSDEARTQEYDCSVALSYDVAFISYGTYGLDIAPMLNPYAYEGYGYTSWCVKIGGEDNSALDTLKALYNSQGQDKKGFSVDCKTSNNGSFTSFSSEEWQKIFNTYIKSHEFPSTMTDTVKFISNYQPMSFLGGTFNSDVSAVTYTFDKYYALYPIDKIKIYKTKPASSSQTLVQHIDLGGDGSYRLQDYYNTISAFDEHNSDWTNWDSTQGYWALVTDEPSTGEEKIIKITSDPVSDGIVSAYKDSKTGLIYINPIKNGKSYIRYVINENVFQYYPNVPGDATDFSTLNLKYVTNDDITAKGTIEINTTNIEHNFDENGFCANCGAYQPAYLNSDGVYEISNAGQLYWFSSLVNGNRAHAEFGNQNGSANAVLIKDIVVNNTDVNKLADKQSETLRKWLPIGTYDNSYSGKFDGRRHTVSGLYFSDSNADNVGLFGYTRGGANISNVGVINSYLKGKNCIGGILGRNNNSGVNVQRCFSEATVIGNEGVGGISGSTYGGKIVDCYNAGSVTGAKFVGSIRGHNTNSSGAMDNCFNVGEVIGTGTDNIGGIRGDGNGTISNCYCISTKLTDTAATTKTPEQFASGEVAYLLNNSVTDGKQVWLQNIDNGETADDYPKFKGGTVYCGDDCIEKIYSNYSLIDTGGHKFNNGFCTKCGEYQHATLNNDGYYEISNAGQLFWFASLVNDDHTHADFEEQNVSANAVLTADVDLEEREWIPIGYYTYSNQLNVYSGKFDGQNHTICGLVITEYAPGEMTGLFGKVNGGTLENFSVKGSITSSGDFVGGVVGYALNGTIVKNISSKVDVNGVNDVGGIAGKNEGTIENCCNLGSVSGTGNYVGGITGFNSSKISCCSNSGSISSSSFNFGGIAGKNFSGMFSSALIINCYNTGNVSCEDRGDIGGGIVGYNDRATVENCYSSGNINAPGSEVNGLIGRNTNSSGSIIKNCYYLDSCGASDTLGSSKTNEQFKSGNVAYLLNIEVTDGSQAWYQNIDNGESPDDYPKFDGGTVYYLEYKDTYSNTYSEPPKPDAFDEDDRGNLIIKTYDDLVNLANLIKSDYEVYGSQKYILTNNIKVSDDAVWVQGIGSVSENKPFNGTFNGNGYCIIGLNVNSSEYGGLFEIIGEKGKVKDLFVFDCDFKASSNVAGGIAAINKGSIDHCISGVNLTTGTIHFHNKSIDAAALNSSIKGNISGGIAGENSGMIIGCRNASVVSGTQCGGIAAVNTGEIYGCANNAKIGTSNSSVSGGLAGINSGAIKCSYNSGKVIGSAENSTGSITGLNECSNSQTPDVTDVFYHTENGLNVVGTDSSVLPDDTNKGVEKCLNLASDSITDELNAVSGNDVVWIRNRNINHGYPMIKGNFLKYSVKSAGNSITVGGVMHKDLNIEYSLCNDNSFEKNMLKSALGEKTILNMYSLSLTDNEGNYIPAELWCQSEFKISVPVQSKNVQLAGIDNDGKVVCYEPDSFKNQTAVFTVSHPMSFAIVENTNTGVNNSDFVINNSGDHSAIQTGSVMCCTVLMTALFALVFTIVFKRRENFE